MRDHKNISEKKLWRFTEGILTEFAFMGKRTEDKILFELGYHDKLMHEQPHERMRFDDLVSQKSVPSISDMGSEIHRRPNTVSMFKPGKDDERLSFLDFESENEKALAMS